MPGEHAPLNHPTPFFGQDKHDGQDIRNIKKSCKSCKSCQKKNKEVKNNVCTYKCAYHRDTQWRLPGDMPDMAPDSGFDSYSRCADLEFHPVYGQENELRKRGLNLK